MQSKLSIQQARNLYNEGYLIQNRTLFTYQPIIFQLLGYHFTTNKRRANKGKHYKLDNKNWVIYTNSFWVKCKLILTNNAVIIK